MGYAPEITVHVNESPVRWLARDWGLHLCRDMTCALSVGGMNERGRMGHGDVIRSAPGMLDDSMHMGFLRPKYTRQVT